MSNLVRQLPVCKKVTTTLLGQFIGAQRRDQKIAIEIKDFRGKSAIGNLEQAIGQYVLYQLLLKHIDPKRKVYLAITHIAYDEIFSEPIG